MGMARFVLMVTSYVHMAQTPYQTAATARAADLDGFNPGTRINCPNFGKPPSFDPTKGAEPLGSAL